MKYYTLSNFYKKKLDLIWQNKKKAYNRNVYMFVIFMGKGGFWFIDHIPGTPEYQDSILDFWKNLKSFFKWIVDGRLNSLKWSIDSIWWAFTDLKNSIKASICEPFQNLKESILGVFSPKIHSKISYDDVKVTPERLDDRENETIEDEISQIGECEDDRESDVQDIRESEVKLHEIISLSDLSDDWKAMVAYLLEEHPSIKIEIDDSTNDWHLYWWDHWNTIVIWTKSKDKENITGTLLHEISHALEQDGVEGTAELKDNIWGLNKKYWKQLFSVSNNHEEYDTEMKRTIEDVCELIALYARDKHDFHEYMQNLQNWSNENLAKISESESENLEFLCKKVISNITPHLNEWNIVQMYNERYLSAAA